MWATRGKKDQVKFDGCLSLEERAYVEEKFGKMTDRSAAGVKKYIKNANQIYFADLAKDFQKQNPEYRASDFYFKQGSGDQGNTAQESSQSLMLQVGTSAVAALGVPLLGTLLLSFLNKKKDK